VLEEREGRREKDERESGRQVGREGGREEEGRGGEGRREEMKHKSETLQARDTSVSAL